MCLGVTSQRLGYDCGRISTLSSRLWCYYVLYISTETMQGARLRIHVSRTRLGHRMFLQWARNQAQAAASDSKVESFYSWSADFRHFICTSGEETAVSRDFPLSLAVIRSSARRIHHQCSQQNSQQPLDKATRMSFIGGSTVVFP